MTRVNIDSISWSFNTFFILVFCSLLVVSALGRKRVGKWGNACCHAIVLSTATEADLTFCSQSWSRSRVKMFWKKRIFILSSFPFSSLVSRRVGIEKKYHIWGLRQRERESKAYLESEYQGFKLLKYDFASTISVKLELPHHNNLPALPLTFITPAGRHLIASKIFFTSIASHVRVVYCRSPLRTWSQCFSFCLYVCRS